MLVSSPADGPAQYVWHGDGATNPSRAVWNMLLGFMQYRAPLGLNQPLERLEEEPNGQYRVLYVPQESLGLWSPPGVQCVGKQKVEYLPPPFAWVPGSMVSETLVQPSGTEVWCFLDGVL